jgi:hypothetical protein
MCSPDDDALFTGALSLELTAKPFRRHLFSGGAHGWNIDIVTRMKTWISVQPLAVRNESGSGAWSFARCWVLRDRTCRKAERTSGPLALNEPRSLDSGVTRLRLWRREYRPYFENYTVDASILDRCVLGLGLCADITNKDLVVVEITSVVC